MAWVEPTRLSAAWRAAKVLAHVLLRSVKNTIGGPARFAPASHPLEAPILAEHRSSLWIDGREDEFVLRCGKVQNLRTAVKSIHGVAVPAGQVLSFWSQLGRPATSRGYAVGREVINGCVVPTVGGGLCQLSNALADATIAAGVELVEHHRHSALIEQRHPSSSPGDATVAWNYVDLRLKADFDFFVEARLTHDELVVRIRSAASVDRSRARRNGLMLVEDSRPVARGCLTCDKTSCFRNRGQVSQPEARTAFLLNERTPEFAKWLQDFPVAGDWLLPWVRSKRRYLAWVAPLEAQAYIALWPGLKRVLRQRTSRGEGGARQTSRSRAAADLSAHYARVLRPEHVNLVVAQELLVPLWRSGALGGRSYEVFVSELPASELQTRLDRAAAADPHATSLRDFRVDVDWQQDEWTALAGAARLVTAHSEVHKAVEASGLSIQLVPWCEPQAAQRSRRRDPGPMTLVFPASALARKGAREVADVARRLSARVLILGTPPSDAALWSGVDWVAEGYGSDWLTTADVVVLPAYVEHQPRALLEALASGVPVVTSPACGLGQRNGVTEVEAGNVDALEKALKQIVASAAAETELRPGLRSAVHPDRSR